MTLSEKVIKNLEAKGTDFKSEFFLDEEVMDFMYEIIAETKKALEEMYSINFKLQDIRDFNKP